MGSPQNAEKSFLAAGFTLQNMLGMPVACPPSVLKGGGWRASTCAVCAIGAGYAGCTLWRVRGVELYPIFLSDSKFCGCWRPIRRDVVTGLFPSSARCTHASRYLSRTELGIPTGRPLSTLFCRLALSRFYFTEPPSLLPTEVITMTSQY